jgi:AraC-like DNA-binding protein
LLKIAAMKTNRKDLICVGHVSPDPAWRLKSHCHHFNELIAVFAGRMHVRIGDEILHARAGDILFYPQRVAHEEWTEPQDPAETFFVGFENKHRDLHAGIPLHSRDLDGRVRQLLSWLYADRDLCAASEQSAPEAFLRAILAEIQRIATVKDDRLVSSIREFIYEHIDQPLTLEDLAEHAGISKFHFLRKYKSLTGRTPMQDLRALRTEYARELILTTNLQIKAIAPRAGLGNVCHLSHLFRKHMNLTPGNLRKNLKATPRDGN